MTLIEQILATKGKYQGMEDAGGRLVPNVQNFGLKAGQRASGTRLEVITSSLFERRRTFRRC